LSDLAYVTYFSKITAEDTVISIGSKWHKELKWMDRNNIKPKRFIAIRPGDEMYDDIYHMKYGKMEGVEIMRTYANASLADDLSLELRGNVKLFANDCIWYDGVIDFVQCFLANQLEDNPEGEV
jgi:hypothetical protein